MLGVAHVLGLLLAIFGATLSLPLATALLMQDGTAMQFVVAAALSSGAGLAIAGLTRRYARELKPRDGFLLVTLGWALVTAAATIPLLLILPDLSLTDAFFEAMSGLTTSGGTVLTGLDELPPSVNMWRHAMHWYGGLGIIVLAVAILPLLGVGGMQLYKAETPGPVKDERLAPRITQTAKSLWFTYAALTAAAILAFRLCGMSWFDAICHAFSVMSLGGFSTHDTSVGYFNSAAIELVFILFMMVATLNFARHFMALRRLSLKPYANDAEGKAIVISLSVSVLVIAALLDSAEVYSTLGESFRHAAFSVVSIATTAGFIAQDYETWPIFAPIWMIFLSCII